jgi:hypothetical protein
VKRRWVLYQIGVSAFDIFTGDSVEGGFDLAGAATAREFVCIKRSTSEEVCWISISTSSVRV